MVQDIELQIKLCEEVLEIAPYDDNLKYALSELYFLKSYQQLCLFEQNDGKSEYFREGFDNYTRGCSYQARPRGGAYVECSYRLALILHRFGREEEALESLNGLRDAQCQLVGEELKIAVMRCEEVLKLDPNYAALRKILAHLHHRRALDIRNSIATDQTPPNYEPAIFHFLRALELLGNNFNVQDREILHELAHLYHWQGDQMSCNKALKVAKGFQDEIAKKHPLGSSGIGFLPARTAIIDNIGHLMNEPDIHRKGLELGWHNVPKAVLLMPGNKIVNRFALNQWRPQMLAVTDDRLVRRFTPYREHLEFLSLWPPTSKSETTHLWSAHIEAQREWDAKNRAPLLKLPPEVIEEGWKRLEKFGVARNSWFVAVHVRDQTLGKDGQVVDSTPTSHRDADIATYYDAFKYIVSQGGWVVRMGSVSMKPMPAMDGVIDYAHTDAKCDWMDVFLCSQSRFYFGTSSGLNGIPISYGTPQLLTNVSPTNGYPMGRKDLFIPKILKNKDTGRPLTFREMLSPPFDYLFNTYCYHYYGTKLQNNTSEEILDTVKEMVERLEGRYEATPEGPQLQQRFRDITAGFIGGPTQASIGSSFICKYKELLPQTLNA